MEGEGAREKLKEVIETLGEGECLTLVKTVVSEAFNETVTFESRSEDDEGMIHEEKWGKSILGQEEKVARP